MVTTEAVSSMENTQSRDYPSTFAMDDQHHIINLNQEQEASTLKYTQNLNKNNGDLEKGNEYSAEEIDQTTEFIKNIQISTISPDLISAKLKKITIDLKKSHKSTDVEGHTEISNPFSRIQVSTKISPNLNTDIEIVQKSVKTTTALYTSEESAENFNQTIGKNENNEISTENLQGIKEASEVLSTIPDSYNNDNFKEPETTTAKYFFKDGKNESENDDEDEEKSKLEKSDKEILEEGPEKSFERSLGNIFVTSTENSSEIFEVSTEQSTIVLTELLEKTTKEATKAAAKFEISSEMSLKFEKLAETLEIAREILQDRDDLAGGNRETDYGDQESDSNTESTTETISAATQTDSSEDYSENDENYYTDSETKVMSTPKNLSNSEESEDSQLEKSIKIEKNNNIYVEQFISSPQNPASFEVFSTKLPSKPPQKTHRLSFKIGLKGENMKNITKILRNISTISQYHSESSNEDYKENDVPEFITLPPVNNENVQGVEAKSQKDFENIFINLKNSINSELIIPDSRIKRSAPILRSNLCPSVIEDLNFRIKKYNFESLDDDLNHCMGQLVSPTDVDDFFVFVVFKRFGTKELDHEKNKKLMNLIVSFIGKFIECTDLYGFVDMAGLKGRDY